MKKLLTLMAVSAMALAAADASGTWKLTGEIDGIAISRVCTLKQTDSKLTGTCKNDTNEVALTGEVKGNDITWQYEVDYDGSKIALVYKGTLDGGTIKGSVDASGTGGSFTAQKQ